LEATGERVGELEALTWDDVDEPKQRWRVSQAVSKTGRARWVQVPPVLFEAVCGLVAREDRAPRRLVFEGFGADKFRTAIARACPTAGVPTFSPHDLRHRRVSLLHEQGVSWARIGEAVGHGDIATTARHYTHVLSDGREVDYASLTSADRAASRGCMPAR
jgi:integrase